MTSLTLVTAPAAANEAQLDVAPPPPPPEAPVAAPPDIPQPGHRFASASGALTEGGDQTLSPLRPGIESEWRPLHGSQFMYLGLTANLMFAKLNPDKPMTSSYRIAAELSLPGGMGFAFGYFPHEDGELSIVCDFMPLVLSYRGVELGGGIGLQGLFARGTVSLDAPWNPLRHALSETGIEFLYYTDGIFGLGLSYRGN